jgi:hypothetical protein
MMAQLRDLFAPFQSDSPDVKELDSIRGITAATERRPAKRGQW